jgi:hypothetical protein
MKKMFPKCPICGSEEGYEFSAFYPDVRCATCKAEWSIFEDVIELKRASEMGWDRSLLNKKYAFKFWKDLRKRERKIMEPKIIEAKISEKAFAPMDYIGGHTDYRKRAIGYIILNPDSLAYETSEASLNKMNIQIPLERFKGIEIRTGKEITFLRWFLIGAWSILFKKKTEYLVLTYEESSGMLQHMVFDFHNQRKMVDELVTLVSYLKRKKSK